MKTILVTGANGTVGAHAVAALAKRPGVRVRAGVRSVEKAKQLEGASVTAVELDFRRPATLAPALAGADAMFLVSPVADDAVECCKRVIDAARAARVKQLVRLSTAGVDAEPGIQFGRWHRAVEEYARSSGIPSTMLRPGSYMSNWVIYFRADPQGTVYLPLGAAGSSYIDPRDIADVAAVVLTGEGHAGKAYTLTGPEALTPAQATETIAKVAGRPYRYVDVPPEAARAAMTSMGAPAWMVDGMLELFAIMKSGWTAEVTPTVQELTGHPARTFAEFARDHAAAWKAS